MQFGGTQTSISVAVSRWRIQRAQFNVLDREYARWRKHYFRCLTSGNSSSAMLQRYVHVSNTFFDTVRSETPSCNQTDPERLEVCRCSTFVSNETPLSSKYHTDFLTNGSGVFARLAKCRYVVVHKMTDV